MSNSSLIQRMHRLLDSFAEKTISAYEFERSIDFHMDAMEHLDIAAIHRARELAGNVVLAHFFVGEEEFGSPADEQAAIREMRLFIETLPVSELEKS